MPLIWPRVHGQPLRTGLQRQPGEAAEVGHAGAAGIPQQGDLVQIHAKTGHAAKVARAWQVLNATRAAYTLA